MRVILRLLRGCVVLGGLVWIAAGCLPPREGLSPEASKECLDRGSRHVSAGRHAEAIGAFERALRFDPRSAQAHLELGMLYATAVPDPAAAMYHFQRYLALEPDSPRKPGVQQLMEGCRLRLLRNVPAAAMEKPARQEIESLTLENQRLQRRVEDLGMQLAQAQTALGDLRRSPPPADGRTVPPVVEPPVPGPEPDPPVAPRGHRIQPGDTLYSISVRYGVTVEALKRANPDVDERRLQVGMTLALP